MYGLEPMALTEKLQQKAQVCENNWGRSIVITKIDNNGRTERGVKLPEVMLKWAGHVEKNWRWKLANTAVVQNLVKNEEAQEVGKHDGNGNYDRSAKRRTTIQYNLTWDKQPYVWTMEESDEKPLTVKTHNSEDWLLLRIVLQTPAVLDCVN